MTLYSRAVVNGLQATIRESVSADSFVPTNYSLETEQMPENVTGRTVLIVDDDAAQRVLITRILNLHNLNVHEAESGEQALELLNNVLPDLIMLDMLMPDMDGRATMAKIRQQLGDRTPPIIGLSGQSIDDEDELGFDDYIVKPFSISVLGDRIRPYVNIENG